MWYDGYNETGKGGRTMKNDPSGRLTAEILRLTVRTRLCNTGGEGCLLLVQSGSGALCWPQGEQIAGPGSILLVGRTDCEFEPDAGRAAELLCCRFPRDMMTEQQVKFFGAGRPPLILQGSPAWTARMRTLLELVAGAWQEPDCPGRLYLALLLHYAGQAASGGSAGSQPRNETVERICAYLTANYRQKLTLGEVAAQFYLSPYYLSRLFRRVTGQSIVDYINVRRIEAALRLLETTDLKINDVAEQTGFSTAAHFRRVFREQVGVGPTQYRKVYRGKKG